MCNLDESDYEILVWNDGSTDNGPDIVVKIASVCNSIRLINCDNKGVSSARNNALKVARGKYIWFVDADDKIVPNTVQMLVRKAELYDVDMLAFCWKALVAGVLTPGIHDVTESYEVMTGRDFFIRQKLMMAPWAYIYKRNFLQVHNLEFPENYKTCEDIQFNQKALFAAKRFITSTEIAYIYRVRSQSATQGKGKAFKVLHDQCRRFVDELVFFLPTFDIRFTSIVLYRNFKEIFVWGRLFIREIIKL